MSRFCLSALLLAFAVASAGCNANPVVDEMVAQPTAQVSESKTPQPQPTNPASGVQTTDPDRQSQSDRSAEQNPQQKQPPSRDWISQGRIRVQFDDQVIRVQSQLEVSNVVVEYQDGTRQKFDDLTGRQVEVQGTDRNQGKTIQRVWVKSGPNLSGEGPGYGQRFDRPAQ